MQKLCAVFLLALSLSACVTEPSGPLFGDRDLEEAPELAPSKEGLRDSTPSCELKGPVNARKCMDGRGEMGNNPGMQSSETKAEKAAKEAELKLSFERNKAKCDTDTLSVDENFRFLELAMQERPYEAASYCAQATEAHNSAAETRKLQPTYSSPTPGSGGGCEWKGRNYSPGQSIYHTEGPIYSSDLFIFGENFETRSGKSGPWQQCECSTSSGHWGCV